MLDKGLTFRMISYMIYYITIHDSNSVFSSTEEVFFRCYVVTFI